MALVTFFLSEKVRPPCEKELHQRIFPIRRVPEGIPRPFWSVMIPTYNRPEYLREALQSVLKQAPGPDEMQIRVLDNCSTKGDIKGLVREVGKGRVEYFRQPRNIVNENWNSAIEQARGHWVHLLHDDDFVLPGFYEAYGQIIESNDRIVLVAGQAVLVAPDGSPRGGRFGPSLHGERYEIESFLSQQVLRNSVVAPAIVARRSSYEAVGGFCMALRYFFDWDMWFRIAQTGVVAGTCQPYAAYRMHPGSGDQRLNRLRDYKLEQYHMALINLRRYRPRMSRGAAIFTQLAAMLVYLPIPGIWRMRDLLLSTPSVRRWAVAVAAALQKSRSAGRSNG
jgi:GT2 family glycosyltransferase